jgi:hypothetical protein
LFGCALLLYRRSFCSRCPLPPALVGTSLPLFS